MILTDIDSLSIIRNTYPGVKCETTELVIQYKDRVDTYNGHIAYRKITPEFRYALNCTKFRVFYVVHEVREFPNRIELYMQDGITIMLNGAKLVKTEKYDDES